MGGESTSRRQFFAGRAAANSNSLDASPLDANLFAATPSACADADAASKADGPPRYLVHVERRAMACQFEVLLNAGQYPDGTEAALAALDLVDAIEAQLTVYRADSEVARLNASAAERPIPLSASLLPLLLRAQQLSADTGGAFDITAGPLVKAWGFFERQGRVPSATALAAARACVGYQKLRLDPIPRTASFDVPGMELNLGAIGKGYALDRAAESLVARGVGDFLLHGGQSSVLAHGADASRGDGWEIGLRDPWRPQRRLAVLRLRDRAIGTSGTGTQFFRAAGRRYGHILDPRSGAPAEGVVSATAVTRSAAEADALATAFYCLGPEQAGKYCASHPEVSAVLVVPTEGHGDVRVMAFGFAPGEIELAAEADATLMSREQLTPSAGLSIPRSSD